MKNINDFINRIIYGDCLEVMPELPEKSIDLIVTDPPYLVRYRARDGRGFTNDETDQWLKPAFAQSFRVLKDNSYCVSFFGWHKVDRFLVAWRAAGFRTLEQLVWIKDYPSSVGAVERCHETAYLLAKGKPARPQLLLRSVLKWRYSGNQLHPTQKPVMAILPLIMAYSKKGDLVLDPFIGSGTTAVAARRLSRKYIGIEINQTYAGSAQDRLKQPEWERGG